MSSKYCTECGSEVSVESKFCSSCGTPSQQTTTQQKTSPQKTQFPSQNFGGTANAPSAQPLPIDTAPSNKSRPNWIAIGGSVFALVFIIALIGSCDELMTETDEERKAREMRERGLDMMNQGFDELEDALNELPD